MAISRKLPKALSDLLTKAKKSGLTDDEIHDRAGLASGWLSGARRGRYGPQAKSWAKLSRFLERLDAGDRFLDRLEKGPTASVESTILASVLATEAVPSAVVLEPDGARTPIGQAILKASTFRRLGSLAAMIAAAVADGVIEDLKKAELLEKFVKTRSGILKKEREEIATAKVRALEILTEEEMKLLMEYRAKLAGPPLKSGDYPPPPTEAAPVSEPKKTSPS